ncbi:hypothetical protein KIH27_03380 [Mycobacterium sp. M1]|uniref:Haemophore haem-binding domain-containing protein n=1 Tax=Mycolicibacter acidiphilus TaxID=2835306 RepID=A0ABS5REB7_9MYCO|nr:hypothetical protein [Mycolicibacter acidiphilus]MBS9532625.1 hypothetical protein [Mycolicibacter acidiphilus]
MRTRTKIAAGAVGAGLILAGSAVATTTVIDHHRSHGAAVEAAPEVTADTPMSRLPDRCEEVVIPASDYAAEVTAWGTNVSRLITLYADRIAHPPQGQTADQAIAAARTDLAAQRESMNRTLTDALAEISHGGKPSPHTVGIVAQPGCPPVTGGR